MKIIVAGCGKIGTAITHALVGEGHNVTVVDIKGAAVEELINRYDVNGLTGSAADYDVLLEAEAGKADLFVSVTEKDEMNMLACLFARRLGAKHTIARIRTTDYNEGNLGFLKQELQLSMALNPDLLAGQQVFNLLRLPSAARIDTFSGKNIEMVELRLKQDNPVCGLTLWDLREKYKGLFLVCYVQRGEDVMIPDGRFTLLADDKIGVIASPGEMQRLLKKMNLTTKTARSIMILGGSRASYYLARRLDFLGKSVKIIDKDPVRCRELADLLPSVSVVEGDGTHQDLLFEEGIRSVDAFVALTGTDEENILLSVFASKLGVKRVITKVNRTELTGIAGDLGLETVISPKKAVTDVVTRYARALNTAEGSKIETLYRIADEKAEAIEFVVTPEFRGKGVELRDLKLQPNTLIAGISRGRKTLIPTGSDTIEPGDRVIVVTAGRKLVELSDIMAGGRK